MLLVNISAAMKEAVGRDKNVTGILFPLPPSRCQLAD